MAVTQSCSNRVMVCSALSEAGPGEIVATDVPAPLPLQDAMERISATTPDMRNKCFIMIDLLPKSFAAAACTEDAAATTFSVESYTSNPAPLLLCSRDLDWFRFYFFFLGQNDFQDAIFVLRADSVAVRSEEHMSELQSLRHLVCRLLLD